MGIVLSRFIVLCLILSYTVQQFARNPPRLRAHVPPAVDGPTATDDPVPIPPAEPVSAAQAKDLRGISSGKLPRHLLVRKQPTLSSTNALAPGAAFGTRNEGAHSGLHPTLTSQSDPWNVSTLAQFLRSYHSNASASPADHDSEPSITALTKNGVTYHFAAWQSNSTAPGPYRTLPLIDKYTSSGGTVSHSPLIAITLPSAYTNCADSGLATNPYSVGYKPQTVYYAAVCFNRDSSGFPINPSSVRVWTSPDLGATWDGVGMSVHNTTGTVVDLDKPTIDVSWFPGAPGVPSTLGAVYVTYVEFALPGSGRKNRILMRRAPYGVVRRCRPVGGGCIDPFDPVVVVYDANVEGPNAYTPNVVVNPTNGNVYVVFLTDTGIKIKLSTNQGGSFPGPARTIATTQIFDYYVPDWGHRAHVIPMARYSPAAGKLFVVWHDKDAVDTNIEFAAFNPDSATSAIARQTWSEPETLYQFQPAVDTDDSGNALISYYETNGDFYCHHLGRYVNASGTTLSGPSYISGEGVANNMTWTGDYHELFYWGTTWHVSWVTRLGYQNADIYVTGSRPQ